MIKGKSKLVFGTGDIMMTPVTYVENEKPKYGMLAFKTIEPHEIGSFTGNDNTYSITDADTLMVFHKIESIDVCIEILETLKKMMLGETVDMLMLELEQPQSEDDFIIENQSLKEWCMSTILPISSFFLAVAIINFMFSKN